MGGMYGQDPYNYTNEVAKTVSIPETPESAAFSNYGSAPINFFNGTPNVQVPLYVHDGIELDLPITLTYDASGIKVNQLPTIVGLGWNLNVGGRITRVPNGAPDDFNYATPVYESWYDTGEVYNKYISYVDEPPLMIGSSGLCFPNSVDANNYLSFLEDMHRGKYETQPDFYNISVLDVNDTFVITPVSKNAVSLKNPRLEISYTVTQGGSLIDATKTIDTFTVTGDDGTEYEFEIMETAENVSDTGDDGLYGKTKRYNTGWFLTKITSPYGKDVYEFFYANYASRNDIPSNAISEVTNPLVQHPEPPVQNYGYITSDTDYSGSPYGSSRKSIDRITHNGMDIFDVTYTTGFSGGPDAAITRIDIFDQASGSYTQKLYKTFDFNYDYFATQTGLNPATANPLHIRLKLDGIDVSGSGDIVQQYFFEYYDPYELPSLTSTAQDYLGYYNGPQNNNQDLYVTNPDNHYGVTGGGNRGHNLSHARKGLLKKIQYPTRGFSEFRYESDTRTTTETVNGQNDEVRLDFTHSAQSLPNPDSTHCNLQSTCGPITPNVGVSSAFYVSEDDSGYAHDITYTKTGNGSCGISEADTKAFLVRVADENTSVTWTDMFNADCELNPDVEVVWALDDDWLSRVSSQQSIPLTEGWYRAVLPIHYTSDTKSLKVEGPVTTTQTMDVHTAMPGLRIEDITDYTADNVITSIREYDYYGTQLTTIERFYTTMENHYFFDTNNGNSGFIPRQVLHRPTHFMNNDKPHVGYVWVTETIKDPSDVSNYGATTYRFDVSQDYQKSSGIYMNRLTGESGASTNFNADKRAGASSGKSMPGYSESSDFEDDQSIVTIVGAYLASKSLHNHYYPVITSQSCGYRIDLVPGITGSPLGPTPPPQGLTDAANFKEEISRLVLRPLYIYGNTGGNVNQTVTKEETAEGSFEVTTDLTYTADDRLKTNKITENNGDVFETRFYYPDEISGPGYSQRDGANMLTSPVKVETYKDATLLSTQLTEYFSSTLPQYIKTAKDDATTNLEERMEIISYDGENNMREVRQTDGTTSVYLWGYDYRYPIAKIDNATWTQVDVALVPNYDTTLQTLDGTALENEMNTMRSGLTDALVTSYTYDPSVGVTTITAPNGVKSSYHYDDFNRLEKITDTNGDIVKEIEYNTLTFPEGPPGSGQYEALYSATAVTATGGGSGNPVYTGSVTGLTGGSGSGFEYKWYYSLDGGQTYLNFSTTTTNSFSLDYDCKAGGDFDGKDILFWCHITDADENNVAPTIDVYSTEALVDCGP